MALRKAGRSLYNAVTEKYDLEEHELTLLMEACRTADICDRLASIVEREGMLIVGRPHAALVELRQQRILLARLIVALRVPMGEQEDESDGRTQRRGVRGVYGIKGVVS